VKKLIGAVALSAALGFVVVACCATDPKKVDQTNNVSIESYRATIVKGQSNLVGNIIPSVQEMMAADLASEKPQHSEKWWKAKLGLLMDTATLNSAALAGSNKPGTGQ